MKGTIQDDHMPVNRYQLLILGIAPIVATEISGIEDELQVVELPDRTMASGGNRAATEFTFMMPIHHAVERASLELWFREAQDPVLPSYKKTATLVHESISGLENASYTISGLFPKKRKLPDLELLNEGELGQIEWTMSADDIIPI